MYVIAMVQRCQRKTIFQRLHAAGPHYRERNSFGGPKTIHGGRTPAPVANSSGGNVIFESEAVQRASRVVASGRDDLHDVVVALATQGLTRRGRWSFSADSLAQSGRDQTWFRMAMKVESGWPGGAPGADAAGKYLLQFLRQRGFRYHARFEWIFRRIRIGGNCFVCGYRPAGALKAGKIISRR